MKPLSWFFLALLCVSCGGSGDDGDSGRTAIFFESDEEIWRVYPDGTGLKKITNSGGNYEDPSLTRDGSLMVVQSHEGGIGRIVKMNSDGSNPMFLTNGPDDDNANWAPDGSFIVFTRGNDIWRMDPDGNNMVELASTGGNFEPSVSPDGTKIAYDNDSDGDCEIYVMNANGSNKTKLTNNNVEDWQVQWSPDGNTLVFESEVGGGIFQIFTMNVDGSNRTQLTNFGSCWEAFFSPDGTQIAFCGDTNDNEDLYVMNRNGTNVRLVADLADYVTEPCWVWW